MKKFMMIALAILTMGACTTVQDYEVAVGKSFFTGRVHENPYPGGLRSTLTKSISKYSLREIQYPSNGNSEEATALTGNNLRVTLDVGYMWRVTGPECVTSLYLNVGPAREAESLVHSVYREATRDIVAEYEASELFSTGRQDLGERILNRMNNNLGNRCITITTFFVRDIIPPAAIRQAVEQKLATEQEVQAQAYRTQVIAEQANQMREEAAGIRDAQGIIAESLVGVSGQRYLYWRALEAMETVGETDGNLVIIPTEGGMPLFFGAPGN